MNELWAFRHRPLNKAFLPPLLLCALLDLPSALPWVVALALLSSLYRLEDLGTAGDSGAAGEGTAIAGRPGLLGSALQSFCWWLPFLALLPTLSDDFQRYLWEGWVQLQGYSPYRHSPAELMALGLDHSSGVKVGHPNMSAVYPPLAQLLFRLVAFFQPHWLEWKGAILLAAAWTWWRFPAARENLLSPLVLVEAAWNGHLDFFALPLLYAMLLALERKQALRVGALLGSLAAFKILPLLWLPFLLQPFAGKERLRLIGAVLGVLFLAYLPFLDDGLALFTSLRTYASTWSFNNGLFHLFNLLFSERVTRAILALLLLGGAAQVYFLPISTAGKLAGFWMVLITCSPTFYPWYLLWLVPFLSPRSSAALFACSALSYGVLPLYRTSGLWLEQGWWLLLEWPLLILLFWRMMRNAMEDRHAQNRSADSCPQ
jgi:hypothetical protein